MRVVTYPLENARFQWERGAEAIDAVADPQLARAVRRLIEAVREELRRELGSSFTAEDLAAHYGRGTDAYEAIAVEQGLGEHGQDGIDAAFWEHLRLARDFSGGVRISEDEAPE